ncbi:hypothetical protein CHLNCDRAFT_141599 [Chlorella variabilis]|uniref:Uncharacterized protein n=1 Tax=Chlorella variabilis TaxID=554065 RepID=E1ZTA5_CHLVA|nr:hypothetical protein CHLNCDRAFT_141599 [Chlorella variabilis]EFN50941.1 hypothetical protein CHLNCDRAFT_141599 [Chlorella variabilis]|eukprot:XP_005843043.1 hypothetical protein CHLNCDRAFT_141599 [Chlorella variabilis]
MAKAVRWPAGFFPGSGVQVAAPVQRVGPPSRALGRPVHAAAAAAGAADAGANGGGATSSASSSKAPPAGFASLELMIANQLGGGPGGDWKEVEQCFVLSPPDGASPRCLVHFIGGSFVGAAPQLAYRPLLEGLAARGALVVAVPYATSFDHLRVADEVHFKFERCLKALGPQLSGLAKLGMGVTSMIAQTVASTSAAEDIDALADEVGGFCGLPPAAPGPRPAALPPARGAPAGAASGGGGGGGSGGGGPGDSPSGSFDANI